LLERVFRDEWPRVLASLIGFLGDVDLAEEAAQEAFALAVERWARDGVPTNPRAWLIVTGRNRAVDRLRRDRVGAGKLRLLTEVPAVVASSFPDERLELVFMCCHPALNAEARVALTLRALGGLSTVEIARAFLVPVETMKRRLSRARTKIRDAAVPFAVPSAADLPARLDSVLAVVYLIFNQGYGDSRAELATEAIRLGRLVSELLPGSPEPVALLALMLLHDSRRHARVRDGAVVPLSEQDRALWNEEQLAEGVRLVARHPAGVYELQAAIAALQTRSEIDWVSVEALYLKLYEVTRSPIVALNRSVAVAETSGPAAALDLVDSLALDDYRYFHSTRAELLRRLGRADEAVAAYRRALDLTTTEAERAFLQAKITELA
jgi:RNA polymerase sigma-70 factor (ECF subfamily)